jgi:membrane protein
VTTRAADPEQPPPREDAAGPSRALRVAGRPDAQRLGRLAARPGEIPWPGWKAVLRRVGAEMITDRVSLVAAGCAFYATLALFPAISMLISIYGLAFDPSTVEPQLGVLRDLLPPAAYTLIADRVHLLVTRRPSTLGIGLVFSTAVTLWSAAAATKGLITALNIAYEETEQRSILRYQLTTFSITLLAIIGAVVGLAVLVGLPAAFAFVGVSAHKEALLRVASLGLLVLFVLASLSALYRYGPCREQPRWHWVTPGSVLATVLWVAVSALFSIYVGRFASYDAAYGPIAAVAGVMMWFFVTVYVVLLGAELNAELELQTVQDSTDGPPAPIGERGAYVADHVAEE